MQNTLLIIGPFPPPVNGCSYANEILRKNIISRGLQCDFINTNTKKLSSKQGNRFSLTKTLAFFHTYLKLYKLLFCQLVYFTPGQTFFGVTKYFPFILICIILQKPYTIHVHGNYLGKEYKNLKGIKKRIFRMLISKASAGIVLSESLLVNFSELLPPDKLFIVENFVEESIYMNSFSKRKDKLRILYLSNLMREKGIFEFLDALIDLNIQNVNFEATVAGPIVDDLELELKSRFEKLGSKLRYIGIVTGEEKRKTLIEANVFILPTYYEMEGQPISLLEGMATGNIIITTNHAGIPDVVSDANGFLVKSKSARAISECLVSISKNIPKMVTKFSEYNKTYSLETFTEKIFTDKILTILYATAKAR